VAKPVHPIVAQLRAIREDRGLSRPQVAALAGVSVHAIEGWEWGHRSPVLGGLAAYAAVLGVDIALYPAPDRSTTR
jgi:transcriptional regulator with XRE-family HTH domain